MTARKYSVAIGFALAAGPASAQTFDRAIFFGDSNTDSGRYLYVTPGGGRAPAGAGGYTTNPGLMWSQNFAAMFGLSANPSAAPGGGTNYAAGGATVADPFNAAWSATQQVAAYIGSAGGKADPNAIYTMWIGVNDLKTSSTPNIVFPQDRAALIALGQQTAGLVGQLSNAGARYFLVPNTPTFQPVFNQGNTFLGSRTLYDNTVWNSIAAAGINFIPADIKNVGNYVLRNPSEFGITNINPNTPACGAVPLAYKCLASGLVAPNADKTHFFADIGGHVSSGVQKIESDYFYSLVVAPSQVSFLAENAVKARSRTVQGIQSQIDVAATNRGPTGLNAWVTGDVSHLKMDNYAGFPSDPSTPLSLAAGIDYRVMPGVSVGGAISTSTLKSTFSLGGDFKQDETTGSAYAAFAGDTLWGNVIGTYGHLKYDVNRIVPIGISQQFNTGTTSGNSKSVAFLGGYKLKAGAITHGPVAGLTLQRVDVGSFIESGSFTSLGFGSQRRDSAISALGWRAAMEMGVWRPFAQISWNHELANTNRDVSAALTTIVAPIYTMPGVRLGKDWAAASVGTTVDLAQGVKGYGSVTSNFAQRDAASYGAQVGLSFPF
jgi:outer membrane lipase/esterase